MYETMKNMKRKLLFAVALVAIAACSDKVADTSIIVSPPPSEPVEIPILFGSSSGSITRTEFYGADAAAKLNRKFVVSGYKGSSTATLGSIVYDNFVVEWEENTANTTESNTTNWEYVGKGLIQPAIDNGVTQQSIKYWDYTMPQYDFIAWSSGRVNPVFDTRSLGAGDVRVSSITPSNATGTGGVAYTIEGSADDLHDFYIADLVTVKKASYGYPVVIRFRSLGTKVRVGLYETIPGYSVKDVKFYSGANTDDARAGAPRLFTTSLNEIYTNGKYYVYYPTVDSEGNADNNQAHVRFEPKDGQSAVMGFSDLSYTTKEDGEKTGGNGFLGRTSKTSSLSAYSRYIPNETGTNLNLRVDYTLESIDGTGETIVVRGATAQVPSIYTRWKAGYAYTYLFKITDQTNGHTGTYDPTDPDNPIVNPDPAGLYPITFAAVVVNDEDNTQENITLVSTPSITTYQEGSNMLNCNEYSAGRSIYVTVSDGDLANGALQSLDGKAALYTIPAGRTEAEVVDAFQLSDDEYETDDNVCVGRNGIIFNKVNLELTNTIAYGPDGNTIIVGANQAAKFTPSAGKTYAFVYTKTGSTATTEKYEVVTMAPFTDVTGLYRNFSLTPASGLAQPGTIYFSMDANGKLSQENPTVGVGSVDGFYVYKSTPSEKHPCMNGELAVSGHSYFDKYYQNNGVYYAKVIKVQ